MLYDIPTPGHRIIVLTILLCFLLQHIPINQLITRQHVGVLKIRAGNYCSHLQYSGVYTL